MSGKRSRTKGHDWEREIAQDLTEARGVPYKTTRSIRPDLDPLGIDVMSWLDDGFIVQAKVGARPPVRRAFREVCSAVLVDKEVPVAAIRWNRGGGMEKDDVAVLRWTDFLKMARQYVHAPGERPDVPSAPTDGIEIDGEGAPGARMEDDGIAP